MNKFEYWFLDTAVEMIIGVSWIIPDQQYGLLGINRAPLNLSITEIAHILYSLFQQGDLLAFGPSDTDDFDLIEKFAPSLSEIEDALEEKFPLAYFLTPQGGEKWESVSKPKWEQYYIWTQGFDVIDEGQLICANREIAEKLLASSHLFSYGNCRNYIIPGTQVWEILTPWTATYWKTLPIGYYVCYQKRTVEIDENQLSFELKERETKAEEERRFLRKWYTDYFKEHGK